MTPYQPQQKIIEDTECGSMAGPHLVCTAPVHFLPDIRDHLETHFRVSYGYNLDVTEIKRRLQSAEAFLVNPGAPYRVDEDLLIDAKSLRFIVTPSTGSDHIDKTYCERRGIAWAALRGHEKVIEQIHSSAEFSFALLMAMIRKLPASVMAAKMGYWREVEDEFRGIELSGKKVGLVGFGRIGKKMSRYVQAFDAEVMAYDPHVCIDTSGVTVAAELNVLLNWADIVCIHVHLDDSTKGMCHAGFFSKMKRGAYFLNTARGDLVDESALIQAIQSGHIAAAAVDVICGEQSGSTANNPLVAFSRRDPRLIVTPHIAGLSVDSQRKAARFAVDQLRDFFKLS